MDFKSLHNWLSEWKRDEVTFNDIFKVKNKWVPVPKLERETLVNNFFELVNHAYEPLGGHLKVESPEDLLRIDWDTWWANDTDEDPQADVVFFGKRTLFGIKIIGVGHDGGREARKESILHRGHFLMKKGAYAEVSGQPYMILFNKFNTNLIKDPRIVQSVLDKPIQWHGEHPEGKAGDPYGNPYWYSRKIGDKMVSKIMMGNPILDVLKINKKS